MRELTLVQKYSSHIKKKKKSFRVRIRSICTAISFRFWSLVLDYYIFLPILILYRVMCSDSVCTRIPWNCFILGPLKRSSLTHNAVTSVSDEWKWHITYIHVYNRGACLLALVLQRHFCLTMKLTNLGRRPDAVSSRPQNRKKPYCSFIKKTKCNCLALLSVSLLLLYHATNDIMCSLWTDGFKNVFSSTGALDSKLSYLLCFSTS